MSFGELKDRMFSEERMYTFLKATAHSKGLQQTATVLPLVKQYHAGQTRRGKDKVPYIYHPLLVACHALALGFEEDALIAAALLHDVVEDCNVTADELPASEEVKEAVKLLSFKVEEGETKEQAKQRYFAAIGANRIATIVKVLDRCNNISSMATAFSKEKMARYIDETERYVFPLLDGMKHKYPDCCNAAFLLKYQMMSVIESLKRVM